MKWVLDTNAVIYLLQGRLVQPLPMGTWYLSVISEIELRSWQKLTDNEDSAIRRLLSRVTVVGLDASVKELTIHLRRQCRLKLPDAVIAATAQVTEATLLTNDEVLHGLSGIRAEKLALRES